MCSSDLVWLHPAGREMTADDWQSATPAIGILRSHGLHALAGHELLWLLNPTSATVPFAVPRRLQHAHWRLLLDSARELPGGEWHAAPDAHELCCLLPHQSLLLEKVEAP